MIRDITDLIEAEEELRERAAALERSNADLERFAYAASHDLQEPLNSIRLSAGAVIEAAKERLDADERELMAHIDAAAGRLSGQVRGLMEVAQVALGRGSGEQVALAVAIKDAIDALRAAAVECGAEIEVQDPVPDVVVPRIELSAVLQNVISNAIKYRRDGVTPRIVIAAEKGEAIIEVRVADNGLGLSDEELDRIFGLFERGASDAPGTGMGLATARRMLERLGGTILARSPGRGQGSEFTVLVPSADGELRRGLRGRLEARALLQVAVGARGERLVLGLEVGEHEDRAVRQVLRGAPRRPRSRPCAASTGRARRRRARVGARAPRLRSRRRPRRRSRGWDALRSRGAASRRTSSWSSASRTRAVESLVDTLGASIS